MGFWKSTLEGMVEINIVNGINMKILIIGNLGYVGPSVIKQLRSSYPGAELIGFDMGLFNYNLGVLLVIE